MPLSLSNLIGEPRRGLRNAPQVRETRESTLLIQTDEADSTASRGRSHIDFNIRAKRRFSAEIPLDRGLAGDKPDIV